MVGRKRPVGRPRKEPAEPEIIVLDSSNSEESELEELSGAGIPAAATPSKRRCVHRMYTHGQKKKVADYARHHGVHAAGRRYGIHHKNPAKRMNLKGQGRKISYPTDIDEQLLAWVLERRETSHIAVSTQMIL